jgi:transposase-like protein
MCPTCKSTDIVKSGKSRKGRQRYLCKSCKRRFVNFDALPGRRVPVLQVADALSMYYEGMSYRDIQRNFLQKYDFAPSTATIYEWMRDFTQRAKRLTSSFKAITGDEWVADETMVRIDGHNVWVWSVVDVDTRYLLATHISATRTTRDARVLFTRAAQTAHKPPRRIVTDGLRAYQDGIEKVFGRETKHVVSEGIRSTDLNNNLAERMQGTIRERTKVMRGMESLPSARLMMDGFSVSYNMRPHSALKGRTPAQVAKLPIVFKDWRDVAALSDEKVEELKTNTFRADNFPIEPVSPRLRSRERAFRMRRL